MLHNPIVPAESELIFQAALARIPGVGARLLRELRTVFGTYANAWNAAPAEWLDVPGASGGLRDRFETVQSSFDLKAFSAKLKEDGIFLIGLDQPGYPEALAAISSPPPVLYARGNIEPLLPDKIAVVGTRKASEYYLKRTRQLAHDLASLGLAIVSGMALGIDGAAHEGALEAEGMTIAVLGSGIDHIYPPQHEALYKEIVDKGLVLSEFPPGTQPAKENFPRRNRIIAGLSHGVIVAEAPMGSGALITADLALENGREVFAFSGRPGFRSSQGCHELIKSGRAKLIDHADDVMEEWPQRKSELLEEQVKKLKSQLSLPGAEKRVTGKAPKARARPAPKPAARASVKAKEEELELLGRVSYEKSHINDVARATGMSIAELAARLTMLELKGLVRSLPGGYYQRL